MSGPIIVAAELGDGVLELHPFPGLPTEQVIEGGRYKYRLRNVGPAAQLEPAELFEPDPDDARTGRFTPWNHVGTIAVSVGPMDAGRPVFSVVVGPRKLEHETEYRSMLEQIADHAAEAILQGFAPASAAFDVDPTGTGDVAYRALAFLVARLRSAEFQHALERIARSPHRQWRTVTTEVPVQHGLPAGAHAARQLARSGGRVPLPAHLRHLEALRQRGLPQRVEHAENVVTFDTPANRFVRYALEHWQALAFDVQRSLTGKEQGPARRGRDECRWLIEQCAAHLGRPPLRDAGPLRLFPQGDPVLRRQAGYRDVLRTFALADASLALVAELPDDPFAATQRNVATLYEYWCFFQLAAAVSEAVDDAPASPPFRLEAGMLSLTLKQGEASRLEWVAEVAGRRLGLSLWFNRDFRRHEAPDAEYATWALRMRPDASLRIRPLSARPGDAVDPALDVWLHFDAKYRITAAEVIDADGTEVTSNSAGAAKRDDLLRMHAYRDAIRRTAGAYVLYPGGGTPTRTSEYHEILPGVGAFPLRPGVAEAANGRAALTEFVRNVVHHAANQASAAERLQFWQAQHTAAAGRFAAPTELLRRPPADEPVLVGYVRPTARRWVTRTRQYNVRADDRRGSVRLTDDMLVARLVLLWTMVEGRAELVGLFERTGPWLLRLAPELEADGYPTRHPDARYLVTALNPVEARHWPADVVAEHALSWSPIGEPVARTWADLDGPTPA